jgi:hypothetical protein
VTDLLVAEDTLPSPDITLTLGVMDTGQYGHNYGSNQNEIELTVSFQGTTVDLVFSVTGYDIDNSDEVAVYLNGNLLGYLSIGPNNGLNGGDSFPIPVSDQLLGENQIRFVQKTPGFMWGVTDLLVAEDTLPSPDITLTLGVMDTGQYGHNYGSNQNEIELTVSFQGTTVDLVFSVTGYDIDFIDELAVYLNDNLLGYLSIGPNNGLNSGDSFPITASGQLAGENRIRFVLKTAGWTWGVTNLLVAEQ